MNAPLFFDMFLDSICRYVESRAGEPTILMATLPAAEGQMVVCPAGSPLYADDMVICKKNCKQMQAVLAVVHKH